MVDQKIIIKQNSFLESLKQIVATANGYSQKAQKFLSNKKMTSIIVASMAGISFVIACIFGITLFLRTKAINTQTAQLTNLLSYSIDSLRNNSSVKQVVATSNTIFDLIKSNDDIKKDMGTYSNYLKELQLPYQYFTQYLFLPRLNIWKDAYTEQIDTSLVGINFLQKDPYNDITLLKKWTDFFANPWYLNESNEITSIDLWDITETSSGYFFIPIDVSFVAPSKRSLLMLVDKLSFTSEKDNVSLFQEFFSLIWQEIKASKKDEISTLAKQYGTWFVDNVDKTIWYSLYNWVNGTGDTTLITDDLIIASMKKVVSCEKESNEMCFYQFREKYRDIPSFAYLFGTDLGKNKTQELKIFLRSMPPIFRIKDFSFDKVRPWILDSQNVKYIGKIALEVYGKWIDQKEISEIGQRLWSTCFADPTKELTLDMASQEISNYINRLSSYVKNQWWTSSTDLWDLKNIVDKMITDYSKYNNYKKIVKLFEAYRMLDSAWICKH